MQWNRSITSWYWGPLIMSQLWRKWKSGNLKTSFLNSMKTDKLYYIIVRLEWLGDPKSRYQGQQMLHQGLNKIVSRKLPVKLFLAINLTPWFCNICHLIYITWQHGIFLPVTIHIKIHNWNVSVTFSGGWKRLFQEHFVIVMLSLC